MTTLTPDGLLMLAEHLNVQTLPPVLSDGPRQDTVEAWERARADAETALHTGGLIDRYGDVNGDVADALYILSRPDAEIIARIYGRHGPRKVCLARRGHQHALGIRSEKIATADGSSRGDTNLGGIDPEVSEAVLGSAGMAGAMASNAGDPITGEAIELRTVWADDNPANLARLLIETLGRSKPADIATFNAPAAELAERFNAASQAAAEDTEFASSHYAEALYHHGVDHHNAVNFGLAMASCHGHTEIVACTYDDGLATMATGAVAIYDTDRGRIVTSPSPAPDGSVWSTITPGSDHRIAHAIAALIGTLPGERWMPPF